MQRRIALLATAFSVVLAFAPTFAHAEDPENLIHQGVELRRKGQDARAEGYFRRAYQLAATPRTAAQLGLVELALMEYSDADAHLTEALTSRDAWVNEHRKSLEDSRASAREKLVRVVIVSAPSGTTFATEGGESKPLPPDATVFLGPGPATIQLAAPGRKPTVIRVEGAPGETRKITVDMPAPPPEPAKAAPPLTSPPPAPSAPEETTPAETPVPTPVEAPPADTASSGRGLRIAGIVVGATGAAVAVLGGVLYAQGNSKKKAIEDAANKGGTYDPANSNWESLRNAGVGCLIGGGVALAGGVGLFIAGKKAGSAEPASVSFVPASGFGVLSFRRSF
jgi:hypothetical protein